jgi:hypothetical protein
MNQSIWKDLPIWQTLPLEIVYTHIIPHIAKPQSKELLWDIRDYVQSKQTFFELTGIKCSHWGNKTPYERTRMINDYLDNDTMY